MKRITFTLTLILIIVTACTPVTTQPAVTNEPSATKDPTSIQPTLPPSSAVPNSADINLQRGNVFLDSTELINAESYPLQFTLILKGSLPTPCHALRVAVSLPDAQNKIAVDVYSVVDPAAICAQVLEPFEENFPLGSFPTGHYTLWVNEEQVAEFDS